MSRTSEKANYARGLTERIGEVHEIYLSQILGIPYNSCRGPDLLGSSTFVEVKSSLTPYWTVLEHQLNYGGFNPLHEYGAFIYYELCCDVEEVPKGASLISLERAITHREVFVTPWSFLDSVYHPDSYSSEYWSISEDDFEELSHTFSLDKGNLFFTKGVSLSDFPSLKKD